MRPPFVGAAADCGSAVAAASAAASRPRSRGRARAPAPRRGFSRLLGRRVLVGRLETSSPCLADHATVCPTGTSPAATAIFSSTPDASASTSWVALSVSSSYSGSPFSTGRPRP